MFSSGLHGLGLSLGSGFNAQGIGGGGFRAQGRFGG